MEKKKNLQNLPEFTCIDCLFLSTLAISERSLCPGRWPSFLILFTMK